ncbi:PspA/IM30 family protein [Salipaludibacillus sp. CF4.18]|uniref:PspA/IM30 family protein n=1 Tax=Salipaludibacillus sp. CF4.18 TaxID=3373081 RepID=UPI003EE7A165
MLRLFRTVKHYFAKGVDVEKHEDQDPVSIADELLKDMDRELSHMRESLNRQIASEKRLKRRVEEAHLEVGQREADALEFLQQDDENSAKLALLKKEELRHHAAEMETLLAQTQIHKNELLQHMDVQTANYHRLQEKKLHLQTKRNQPRPPTVHEVEELKVHEKRDFFLEHPTRSEKRVSSLSDHPHIENPEQEMPLNSGDELPESPTPANETSGKHGVTNVEERLEELKKSLKQKELGE